MTLIALFKKPQNLIHEAIHAEVNNALLDPQSEQDQQLGKELEYYLPN